jgi:hypothetical protein
MRGRTWLQLAAMCLPLAIYGAGTWLGLQSIPDNHTPPRQLGFTFSYREAQWYGLEPDSTLGRLLALLDPDVVRLPVYWWDAEPVANQFSWSVNDQQLEVVAAYNRLGHHVGVVLTLGERNLRSPEDYRPNWVPGMSQGLFLNVNDPRVQEPLRAFLAAAGAHFWHRPELLAWQLENEPFDPIAREGQASKLAAPALRGEYLALKHSDPLHPVMVTSYIAVHEQSDVLRNSGGYLAVLPLPGFKGPAAGHPLTALGAGDAMGLDLYFVPRDWIADPEQLRLLITWNLQVCQGWAAAAHARSKQFWVTEFQAEPWVGNESYGPSDMVKAWSTFSALKADGFLFWGAEYWAAHSDWLAAARLMFARPGPGLAG